MLAAPLLLVSLFWFGWSSKASVHWISSEIATVIFGVGAMGVSATCLQYCKCYDLAACTCNTIRQILGLTRNNSA
jgi:DHA1 family multidrug resistance protein-like MFS transporter